MVTTTKKWKSRSFLKKKKTLKNNNNKNKKNHKNNNSKKNINLIGGASFLEGLRLESNIKGSLEDQINSRIDVYGEDKTQIKLDIENTVKKSTTHRTLTIGMNPSGTNYNDVTVLNKNVGAAAGEGAAEEQRIENILKNSVITFPTTHGRSEQTIVEQPHIVPQNVILCFTAILGEFNTDRTPSPLDPEYAKMNQWMRDLNVNQFRELFQFRSHFAKDNLTVTPNLYYDFFRNSTWYYPGQPYPDLKLVIFSGDSNMLHNFTPIDISFPALNNDSKIIKEVGAEFLNLDIPSESLHIHPKKKSDYQYKLSSAVNNMCANMPLRNGFRLFILPQCRELIYITYEKAKQMLELELYYYHLNSITDKEAIGTAIQTNTDYCFNNSKSLRKKILVRYPASQKLLKPVYYLTSGGKIHSYQSQTPSLVPIRYRMENQIYSGDQELHDFRYLNTLSPHKIILFFRNFESLMSGKKKRGLLRCCFAHPDTEFKTNMGNFLIFCAENNGVENYLLNKIQFMIDTLIRTPASLLLLHAEPENIQNMIHDFEIILAQCFILTGVRSCKTNIGKLQRTLGRIKTSMNPLINKKDTDIYHGRIRIHNNRIFTYHGREIGTFEGVEPSIQELANIIKPNDVDLSTRVGRARRARGPGTVVTNQLFHLELGQAMDMRNPDIFRHLKVIVIRNVSWDIEINRIFEFELSVEGNSGGEHNLQVNGPVTKIEISNLKFRNFPIITLRNLTDLILNDCESRINFNFLKDLPELNNLEIRGGKLDKNQLLHILTTPHHLKHLNISNVDINGLDERVENKLQLNLVEGESNVLNLTNIDKIFIHTNQNQHISIDYMELFKIHDRRTRNRFTISIYGLSDSGEKDRTQEQIELLPGFSNFKQNGELEEY